MITGLVMICWVMGQIMSFGAFSEQKLIEGLRIFSMIIFVLFSGKKCVSAKGRCLESDHNFYLFFFCTKKFR